MRTYKSGTEVGYGLYAAPKALDVRFVGCDGEILEGKPGASYFRLPIALMILASPVLGGLFVIAFPMLVVLFAAYSVIEFALNKLGVAAKANAHIAVMRWEPNASYLNKKNKKED